MANYSVWMLEASNITVSGGQSLSGLTQGDGSHLVGETIRLENNNWLETFIRDNGTDTNFDDNDGNQRLDGAQTIDGVSYSDGTRVEAEYRITVRDPATGDTWDAVGYNIVNSSPAYATIEGLSFVGGAGGFPPIGVDLVVDAAFEGPGSSGQSPIDAGDLAAPICFTRGTLITTPDGARRIETLSVGDLVCTADAGPLPIRWIGHRRLTGAALAQNAKLCPVRLRAGALGAGLPEADLVVSRQHRVLLRSPIAKRMFDTTEIMVPAIKLVNMPGIDVIEQPDGVEYWHFLLDDHHVVYSNGAPTESLFTGPQALEAVSAEAREEIETLFPEICAPDFKPVLARPVPPKGKLIAQFLARHLKNRKDLLAPA